MLLLLLTSPAVLDFDHSNQVYANGERWRCLQSIDVDASIDDALQHNHTGLGWSEEFVQTAVSNLTGCQELVLDGLNDPLRLPPLALAIKTACSDPYDPLQLRLVDLEGSVLEDDGLQMLAPAIGTCQTISSLHLPGNKIGDLGARALAGSLLRDPAIDQAVPGSRPHAGLRLLDLHANHISDLGADGLANLLRLPAPPIRPVPLSELRLHDNNLGVGALKVLADALRDNVLLETLMLSGNPAAGDAGVIALADALHARNAGRDSALRRLFLSRMNLTDTAVEALRLMLQQQNAPPLELITVDGNPRISVAAQSALQAAVQARHSQLTPSQHSSTISQYGVESTGIFIRH